MMEKLKPCPFCGGEAEVQTTVSEYGYWVKCKECEAETSPQLGEQEAVDAWNRRV